MRLSINLSNKYKNLNSLYFILLTVCIVNNASVLYVTHLEKKGREILLKNVFVSLHLFEYVIIYFPLVRIKAELLIEEK
jgi:hypothetical protein